VTTSTDQTLLESYPNGQGLIGEPLHHKTLSSVSMTVCALMGSAAIFAQRLCPCTNASWYAEPRALRGGIISSPEEALSMITVAQGDMANSPQFLCNPLHMLNKTAGRRLQGKKWGSERGGCRFQATG